jgi:hypothetical protein
MKYIKFLFLLAVFTSVSFSQFDKPVIQIGIGIAEPFGNTFKGTYYNQQTYAGFTQYGPLLQIDSNFMTNNYGAKTGFSIMGKGKINFDKYSTVRGLIHASFNTFNTFEPSKSGNVLVAVDTGSFPNVGTTYLPSSASFNYTFNAFSFGLGIEVSPLSFTNLVSPYFGAGISFNAFNGKLSRTENRIDSVSVSFSDFRIGVVFDAGIEAKFSKTFGLALGIKYDLGNLLLKNTNGGLADRIEWGKTNASLNDEEGQFYSELYTPVVNGNAKLVNSKKKDINWGTIYLAANIYLNTTKTTKKSPTKK